RGLALDEDRICAHFEDLAHGQHVRLRNVFQSGDEPTIARYLLVPPAVPAREQGADIHLINGGVELDPGKTLGKSRGIAGKEFGKIRILKIAQPIRNAEMAKISDGDDLAF